jgi:hypothetical protein
MPPQHRQGVQSDHAEDQSRPIRDRHDDQSRKGDGSGRRGGAAELRTDDRQDRARDSLQDPPPARMEHAVQQHAAVRQTGRTGTDTPSRQTSVSAPNRSREPGSDSTAGKAGRVARADHAARPPDPILFQAWFKSVGPRTYAAQIKRARNGNHYLVLTEGKRAKEGEEVRKTSVYLFSEDFAAFEELLTRTLQYIREHPISDAVAAKRRAFWSKRGSDSKSKGFPSRAKQSSGRGVATSAGRG